MGKYLEDKELDSVLENYFEEENNLIYESCMIEYLVEMGEYEIVNEANKTDAEKEAEKKEKFENRIAKAKESIKKKIQGRIKSSGKKYSKFKLDCHEATNKERAQFLAMCAAQGMGFSTISSTANTVIDLHSGAATLAKMGYSKEAIKGAVKVAAKHAPGAIVKRAALVTAISVGAIVLIELIKMKRYKDVYTVKLYGIKEDGSEKLIGWWTSVKIQKSDLNSEYRNKIK
jgi:hypothetical protein